MGCAGQPDAGDEVWEIMHILHTGCAQDFEKLATITDDFPNGKDRFLRRRWIINAIDSGSIDSIKWMLSKNVPLDFVDEEGRTVTTAAMERDGTDRYEVLELLLKHHAPLNAESGNRDTPAHFAALANDVRALELLSRYGANMNIRTTDGFMTPLDLAIGCGKKEAAEFLQKILP